MPTTNPDRVPATILEAVETLHCGLATDEIKYIQGASPAGPNYSNERLRVF